MRRTYISPEYKYDKVNGTLSMLEKNSLFGSKMINIDNDIVIQNDNIAYYQSPYNEQLDMASEQTLPHIQYNCIDDKLKNHTLSLVNSQTSVNKNSQASWELKINLNTILNNYLFATLKKYRTFEGVKNNITKGNDVNAAITDYISLNIINKYKFDYITLYISYNDLLNSGQYKYVNIFDPNVESMTNVLNKIKTVISTDEKTVTMNFNQEKAADKFSFNYYYNIKFTRI